MFEGARCGRRRDGGPPYPPAVAPSLRELDLDLDLDRGVQRQHRDAHRAAGVDALVAQDLAEEFATRR